MKAYLITFILCKRLTPIGQPDQKLQIFEQKPGNISHRVEFGEASVQKL
jgi:hypothetical protein